jgi:Meiotically Up-regulated Gene 113 (MUG113) protein
MPVYMIRAGMGPVKLGHTNDHRKRLNELQVAHYERLRIIRLFEGGEPEEASLHLRFADLHLRGEWFSFSKLMLGDVGLVDYRDPVAAMPEPFLPESNLTLDEILLILGGDRAVADYLGCGQPAVSNWKVRGVPPLRQIGLVEMACQRGLQSIVTLEEVRAASQDIAASLITEAATP